MPLDVIAYYKKAIVISPVLTQAERDSLSVAYKDGFRMKRAAWRIVSVIEDREKSRIAALSSTAAESGDAANGSESVTSPFLGDIQAYRRSIEGEIEGICGEVVELIDRHLLAAVSDDESRVFYLKLYGPSLLQPLLCG